MDRSIHTRRPPQQPKKRHWARNILLAIAGLVVLIIVVSVALSAGSGVSTTPSGTTATPQAKGSSAASHAASSAGVGSYFDVKDSSGDTYQMVLIKVSGSPQNEDANSDAAVVGSNGQTYNADFDSIVGYTNFNEGQINVAQGRARPVWLRSRCSLGSRCQRCSGRHLSASVPQFNGTFNNTLLLARTAACITVCLTLKIQVDRVVSDEAPVLSCKS